MEIVKQNILEKVYKKCGDKALKKEISHWVKETSASYWGKFSDIRDTYSDADKYKECVIFNIKSHRLITIVNYKNKTVEINNLYKHKEYDRNEWKKCCKR